MEFGQEAARLVGRARSSGRMTPLTGFEQGGFEDGGEFANVAGPVVLEEAGEGAGAERDGALLVAGADAVEQGLGEWGDVFAAWAQRWDGEANGAEAEGEVGQQAGPGRPFAGARFATRRAGRRGPGGDPAWL